MGTTIEFLEWNAAGAVAAERLRERGVHKYTDTQYMAEFKQVCRERAEQEAKQRREIAVHISNTHEAMGRRDYSAAAQAVIQNDLRKFALSGTTSLHRLAGVLTSLRDPSDGKIPTALAVDLLAKLPDDVMAAARQRLDDLAHKALVNTGIQLSTETLTRALNEVEREFPSLAAAANRGTVSRALLEVLFWPQNHAFK